MTQPCEVEALLGEIRRLVASDGPIDRGPLYLRPSQRVAAPSDGDGHDADSFALPPGYVRLAEFARLTSFGRDAIEAEAALDHGSPAQDTALTLTEEDTIARDKAVEEGPGAAEDAEPTPPCAAEADEGSPHDEGSVPAGHSDAEAVESVLLLRELIRDILRDEVRSRIGPRINTNIRRIIREELSRLATTDPR